MSLAPRNLLHDRTRLAFRLGTVSVVNATGSALVIAGLAAVLPIKRVAGLNPAMDFRGR